MVSGYILYIIKPLYKSQKTIMQDFKHTYQRNIVSKEQMRKSLNPEMSTTFHGFGPLSQK
jgi:hypothetical protein